MKDVASCDKLGVSACDYWFRDVRISILYTVYAIILIIMAIEPWELKYLSTTWKRNQWDFLSSGERNGNSPNWIYYGNIIEMWGFGVIIIILKHSRSILESDSVEGDTPVGEM